MLQDIQKTIKSKLKQAKSFDKKVLLALQKLLDEHESGNSNIVRWFPEECVCLDGVDVDVTCDQCHGSGQIDEFLDFTGLFDDELDLLDSLVDISDLEEYLLTEIYQTDILDDEGEGDRIYEELAIKVFKKINSSQE